MNKEDSSYLIHTKMIVKCVKLMQTKCRFAFSSAGLMQIMGRNLCNIALPSQRTKSLFYTAKYCSYLAMSQAS